MFDVGFWEILLIFGLGLMILGPEKLPRIAAQLGRWIGRARRTASQLRYQLEREVDLGDRPRPRYTPPPKTSQIMPPPGKQPTQAGPEDATGEGSVAGEDSSTGSASASEPPAADDPGASDAPRNTPKST